jgi:hypothetical protein
MGCRMNLRREVMPIEKTRYGLSLNGETKAPY